MLILVLGVAVVAVAQWLADPRQRLGAEIGGAIFLLVGIFTLLRQLAARRAQGHMLSAVAGFVAQEPMPSYIADLDGRIAYRNPAAGPAPDDPADDTLAEAFRDIFANPASILFRLQNRVMAVGSTREDIATRRGHLRIAVHQVGPSQLLWRIEDMGERVDGRPADRLSLPMLTAGPSGTILYMNAACLRLLGERAKSLDRVVRDLPLASGRVHQIDTVNGPVRSLVAVVAGAGGRKEIYLLPSASASATPLSADWDAIEDLPVPLLKIAPSGEVLASNREARLLLRAPMDAGTRLSDLLEGLGRPIVDWLQDVASGRGSAAPQFLCGRGNDQDIFVQVSLSIAGHATGPALIAVLNDVTELKSLEAQFVQSQKMQAIGQLAGGIAHDFNNLLTAISGHCDLLLLRHDQGDGDYGDLQQIHQNANRAASLVGQLLAFSRKQNLRPEIIDLRDTLADLTHLLNRLVGEKVKLTLNHDPELQAIRADKRQLEQVIMNLVVNARDAMPAGGEIRVETENLTLASPVERDRATLPAGHYVLVKVIDEGHGIAPEKVGKIFEPFYTTKRTGEGTGLGLSTAYGIVKQTGGFIFVDSEVGIGTVFTLYLPSYDKLPLTEVPAPVRPAPPRASGPVSGVVLLVEDEAPVRAFASRALRLRGYTVLEADSAEAALALLSDPELVVDIFVTDVIMPGKDGPTWVREALHARPETRVVFVSGYAEDAFGEHQAQIPNSVFLPKPFSLRDLTATVQAQLDDAGPDATVAMATAVNGEEMETALPRPIQSVANGQPALALPPSVGVGPGDGVARAAAEASQVMAAVRDHLRATETARPDDGNQDSAGAG
ncbi:MAG: response regulator [Limimaricola sp.]|uniref:hybrid sensor histidine kinase/response regulator n=1 Tax=Limimaricola sp. TaxID=2211665 RepID=UPI001D4C374D|nr:ATP-binding protein [Limimaricola sp.]MBI1418260.1 response regulator [Limimaricola sp.]